MTLKVEEIVLEDEHVCDDTSCPVETTGPAWQPACGGRPQVACTGNSREDDGPDESMGGNDPPLDDKVELAQVHSLVEEAKLVEGPAMMKR